MRAERYRIEVSLDPVSHGIIGRSVLDLVRAGGAESTPNGWTAFEILLHPDLRITHAACSSGRVSVRTQAPQPESSPNGFTPRKHTVSVEGHPDSFALFLDYEGRLYQDASAGEKAGEIHNFAMRAHVGTDGIYLADGYWYPQPDGGDEDARDVADFTLISDPVSDQVLVASGESDAALAERTGRLAWRSPYPLDGMILVGGSHRVFRSEHHGVDISVHLKADQSVFADGLLDAVRRNFDRYEPLIGPYPAREYKIVDNFFSSGFAFPTFTLLSSAVINMGQRSQTAHGYIDHEMLHSWWGNGVFIDPRDGNWCEALASYGANYYGYVLDGNEEEARRSRRNASHFLSRLTAEEDKPLRTYGREGGCGRGIAYQKGAMVFHMLARRVGQDNFWAAMRRLTAERTGARASWEDIRRICEEVARTPLEPFFEQWVRRGGAPSLTIESARFDSSSDTLLVRLSQGEPPFELDVPLRITHAGGTVDMTVPVRAATEEVPVRLEVVPTGVEVDPDFHVFRKVASDDIIPTTSATRRGDAFAAVLPAGDVAAEYKSIASIFASSFKENERIELTVGDLNDGVLAKRCVLVLGEAARDPFIAAFLSAVEFPVKFEDGGFTFDGVTYADPADAVLCTIRHPDVLGGGITVVYGNSAAAIPGAWNIPMYDRSLVIFRDKMPVLRRDFERRHVVPVQ